MLFEELDEKKQFVLKKCEETSNKIINLREAIVEVLRYGDGVVDAGIVPPESIADFMDYFRQYSVCLENMSGVIFEFVKFIRNYATIGIKFREIIIQEEQLLADITQKVCDCELNMERVEIGLRCATGTVDYWYSQIWPNGKSNFNGDKWLHTLEKLQCEVLLSVKEMSDILRNYIKECKCAIEEYERVITIIAK